MELIIIALIAVEVIIVGIFVRFFDLHSLTIWTTQALIRDGPELWHMATGSGDSQEDGTSIDEGKI